MALTLCHHFHLPVWTELEHFVMSNWRKLSLLLHFASGIKAVDFPYKYLYGS